MINYTDIMNLPLERQLAILEKEVFEMDMPEITTEHKDILIAWSQDAKEKIEELNKINDQYTK